MEFYKFPSIEQFRHVVKNNHSKIPLEFEGTVKLHGTHADIVYVKSKDIFYCQSRNRIIAKDDDNLGFAKFVDSIPKNILEFLFEQIVTGNPDLDIFILNGEWCGNGIQTKVAIAQVPKMFVIYSACAVNPSDPEHLIKVSVKNVPSIANTGIYSIYLFQTWNLIVDFTDAHTLALATQKLEELTLQVEKECPVGKYFGVSGTGEGIVWKCITPGFSSARFWFKVKGEEHSPTKVKKLVSVDPEKVKNLLEFVEKVTTEQRLQQGFEYLKEMNFEISKKSLGEFLKWISLDVEKEEIDTIKANKFDIKKVKSEVSKKAREWFSKQIEA